MLEWIGVLIMIGGLAVAVYLLREQSVDWKGFSAIAVASIVAGVVIANLPYISELGVKGGDVSLQIKRQVERVETRAKEVEQIADEVLNVKEQVKLLVQNATNVNDKIKASEEGVAKLVKDAESTRTRIEVLAKQAQEAAEAIRKTEANVAQMRDSVRQTWRSLLESYMYAIGTRNLFPPPDYVVKEIDRHLNMLAVFAYPDPQERSSEVARIMALIRRAQGQPGP